MAHNKEFITATQEYGGLISQCFRNVDENPNKVLEVCDGLQLAITSDSRIRGRKEYTSSLVIQLDTLREIARTNMYSQCERGVFCKTLEL